MTALALPEQDAHAEHLLVRRLVEQQGATWVDLQNLADFTGGAGDRVLFFSGDPVRFPEALDVAVVLPELQKAFAGRFVVGVVRRECEDAVAQRWGAQRWPSLVFVREGRYVATVAGMLDWTDYLVRVQQALDAAPSRAPIAVISADGGASCH